MLLATAGSMIRVVHPYLTPAINQLMDVHSRE
jgi:hypothetical protein